MDEWFKSKNSCPVCRDVLEKASTTPRKSQGRGVAAVAEVSETPANRGGGESQIAKNVEYGECGMKNAARTRERVEKESERENI